MRTRAPGPTSATGLRRSTTITPTPGGASGPCTIVRIASSASTSFDSAQEPSGFQRLRQDRGRRLLDRLRCRSAARLTIERRPRDADAPRRPDERRPARRAVDADLRSSSSRHARQSRSSFFWTSMIVSAFSRLVSKIVGSRAPGDSAPMRLACGCGRLAPCEPRASLGSKAVEGSGVSLSSPATSTAARSSEPLTPQQRADLARFCAALSNCASSRIDERYLYAFFEHVAKSSLYLGQEKAGVSHGARESCAERARSVGDRQQSWCIHGGSLTRPCSFRRFRSVDSAVSSVPTLAQRALCRRLSAENVNGTVLRSARLRSTTSTSGRHRYRKLRSHWAAIDEMMADSRPSLSSRRSGRLLPIQLHDLAARLLELDIERYGADGARHPAGPLARPTSTWGQELSRLDGLARRRHRRSTKQVLSSARVPNGWSEAGRWTSTVSTRLSAPSSGRSVPEAEDRTSTVRSYEGADYKKNNWSLQLAVSIHRPPERRPQPDERPAQPRSLVMTTTQTRASAIIYYYSRR